MRLPWRRRPKDGGGPSAADEALELSERQHQKATESRREFDRLAERMRQMREHNHLGEAFRDAFGEGR